MVQTYYTHNSYYYPFQVNINNNYVTVHKSIYGDIGDLYDPTPLFQIQTEKVLLEKVN